MVGTSKPKKLSMPKNAPKKKEQCAARTRIIVVISFLVGLIAISSLYLRNFTELTGLDVLEKQEVIHFDETKIKASSIAGTVWKNEEKIEETGNIYIYYNKDSGSKEIIFRLSSTVDNLQFDDSSVEQEKLKIVAAIDIDRNGHRLASKQIDVCLLDKDHVEICQAAPSNKIAIHKEVPLPRYLFSGKYHLSGKLEVVAESGPKWELGYVECDVKL